MGSDDRDEFDAEHETPADDWDPICGHRGDPLGGGNPTRTICWLNPDHLGDHSNGFVNWPREVSY